MVDLDIGGALLSRRRLLAGAGAAGLPAVLLAGCGDDTKNLDVKTAPDESDTADVELLNSMLDLEFMSLAAYKAVAGRLAGADLQIVQGFLEQERQHADTLSRAILDLNGVPNRADSSYALRTLSSARDALRFATGIENNAIAAYIDVLPKLSQGRIRSTISAILTGEAEHAAVLAGALHAPQVPDAFVVGRPA